jgi:undecaprenyl-diphosphatase
MRLFKAIHSIDVRSFNWCQNQPLRNITLALARAISYSANGPLYALAGAVFIAMQHWLLVEIWLATFVCERVCYFVCKSVFRRNRPPAAIPGFKSVIEPSDQFSFPSGHTSAAFVVACSLAYAFPASAWYVYPWACSVGVSRVLLGVHFPTDILAGALMGFGLVNIMIASLAG